MWASFVGIGGAKDVGFSVGMLGEERKWAFL